MRRRTAAVNEATPIESLAAQARGGDGAAADELVVRLYPAVFRLTAALVGDAEVAETTTREAFDRAIAADATPFTEVVVREARELGRQRRSDDAVGLGPLSDTDRSVVVLVDVEGKRYHEVAALLGLSSPEVAMAHARAREHLGVDLSEQRCVGWSLVSRADDLSGPEAAAVQGHLDLCRECATGVRERTRARDFLVTHLPEPATIVAATGLLASAVAMAKQPAAVGGVAAAAAAAAIGVTLALTGSAGNVAAVATPPAATTPDTEAPTTSASASPATPGVPAVEEPEPTTAPPATTVAAPRATPSQPDAVAVPPPPAAVPPPPEQHDPPTSSQALVAATSSTFAPGVGRITQHLTDLGYTSDTRIGAEVTAANVTSWIATADASSPELLVVHLTFETARTTAPAFLFGDGAVPAGDVASSLPEDRPTVVVLDLYGVDRPDVSAFVAAFSGDGRIVVGGFTAVTDVLGDGATGLSEALWDEALIGGAGDTDGDERVSVEEAFAYAGGFGFQRGWTAFPEADDRHEGATHLA